MRTKKYKAVNRMSFLIEIHLMNGYIVWMLIKYPICLCTTIITVNTPSPHALDNHQINLTEII